MFSIRELIRIADQSGAAVTAKPPQPEVSTKRQTARDVFRDSQQQQLERPCTKAQQEAQQRQQ